MKYKRVQKRFDPTQTKSLNTSAYIHTYACEHIQRIS